MLCSHCRGIRYKRHDWLFVVDHGILVSFSEIPRLDVSTDRVRLYRLSKVDPDYHDFEELLDAICCSLLRSNTIARDAHDRKVIVLNIFEPSKHVLRSTQLPRLSSKSAKI